MAENQGNAGGDKLVYFLIGAGIGAVTALLFAPKTGSELRSDIADATRKGIDQARDTGRDISERASEAYQTSVERAGELYQTGVERAGEVAARSKEAVSGIGERGKEAIQRQKSSITAALEAGKQGYREAKQSDQAKAAFEES